MFWRKEDGRLGYKLEWENIFNYCCLKYFSSNRSGTDSLFQVFLLYIFLYLFLFHTYRTSSSHLTSLPSTIFLIRSATFFLVLLLVTFAFLFNSVSVSFIFDFFLDILFLLPTFSYSSSFSYRVILLAIHSDFILLPNIWNFNFLKP